MIMNFQKTYFDVVDFLHTQYGHSTSWQVRRILLCLDAGQYLIRRDSAGKITTYCGWFLIDRDDIPAMVDRSWDAKTVADVNKGEIVWVMDFASIDKNRTGVRDFIKHIAAKGYVSAAWLHKGDYLVQYDRRKGVKK